MPPKQKVPAPIDRPLSRAYLREFKGWSTAYPPGTSDPTSLRVMENILINRDGSAAIRPGLRLLSREGTGDLVLESKYMLRSAPEPFYDADGNLVHLAAMLDTVLDRVVFRVLKYDRDHYDTFGQTHWDWLPLSTAGVAFDVSAWAAQPGGVPSFSSVTQYVDFLQVDNRILALSDNAEPLIVFHVGATKKATRPQYINQPQPNGTVSCITYLTTPDWLTNDSDTDTLPPSGLTNTALSLSSSDQTKNVYNLAFWYTYANELGESVASEIWSTKMQRPWGSWLREAPFAANVGDAPHPNGTPVQDPRQAADHTIVRLLLSAEFDAAKAAGATKMNLYMMTWSDQTAVPVEGQLIAQRELPAGATFDTHGWWHVHPGLQPLGPSMPIPTKDNRVDTSNPSHAATGIVASDRIVLVNDRTKAATIRWSTNRMGDYLNFSSSVGGGYKTLTTGNLQLPATVKLWQNPQSVDTLIILCNGTDGHSSSFYMAPASVTSQSDNTTIMGFEETTATPGTVSPYGCEVANNALYHPLDDQLMKSTASNYNINHKSMTDQIANKWTGLLNKKWINVCFFDQRLYFLVHNPDTPLEFPQERGNEIWVLDLAAEGGTWSRWLVGGVALTKLMRHGRLHLGLVRPEGVFFFDDTSGTDDTIEAGANVSTLVEAPIPWKLETNVQGANRAHDAWCHLQQANLTAGNFVGTMRYGIRGKDRHGRVMTKSKIFRQLDAAPADRFDLEDMLLVKLDLKEWFFFAESVADDDVVRESYGQLNLVQYRYTPISVNQDYEEGSVETFEYGRDTVNWTDRNTLNGVTIPRADTGSP